MAGLYIHIPFCRSKCLYCDFYSKPCINVNWNDFVNASLNEYKTRTISNSFDTIYLGGGTPSLIPPEYFIQLIRGLDIRNFREFTIEANPEDIILHPEIIDVWLECGVNRISVGIQTLDDHLLRSMGRRHTSADACKAISILKQKKVALSIDIIFGLPGQTLQNWENTINRIIEFCPQHLSIYSLMYEEGTALTSLRDKGKIKEIPDDLSLQMYAKIMELTQQAGYHHYEISNFALPGHEAKHNFNYWTGKPYLGLGPAAHSYDGDKLRQANPANTLQWMNNWLSDNPADITEKEVLTLEMRLDEMLLTRLRTAEGLDIKELEHTFGKNTTSKIISRARPFLKNGQMKLSNSSLSITNKGFMIADSIILNIAT